MTLTLKIQLRGITKPPVWRRIEIPANLTFHDLHLTIQKAFGWEDYHLFQFEKQPFSSGWQVTMPDDDGCIDSKEPHNAKATVVGDFLEEKRLKKLVYVYDFGDDWVHDITVEQRNDDTTLKHPVCHGGKGACPPEDCGGSYAYQEMKQLLLKNPGGEEAMEYAEWMGLDDPGDFDPNEFSLVKINTRLAGVKASKPKKQAMRAVTENNRGSRYDNNDDHYRNFAESMKLFAEMLRDMDYLMGDEGHDLSELDDDELDRYFDDYDDDSDNDFFDNYIEGFYYHGVMVKRYEVQVKGRGSERLLQVPSNMTLTGVGLLIMRAFGQEELPEHYEFVGDDGFRYMPDADKHALDKDYFQMDNTDYSCLSDLLWRKGDSAQLKLNEGKEATDTYQMQLLKKGRYTDRVKQSVDLLKGTGDGLDEARQKVADFGAANPLPKEEG